MAIRDWNVSILPKAEEDLAALGENDPGLKQRLVPAILDEFQGMKVQRIERFLVQGTASKRVDRLDGSEFPGSIRLRIKENYRVTILCLPSYGQAYVVHVFHKAQDPKYRRAVPTHNMRLVEFVEDFNRFMDKRK